MGIDNTTLNLGVGGDLIATENRGGVKVQKTLVELSDSSSVDAFGRLRTSNHETIFDSSLLFGSRDPLFWEDKQVSGTSTAPTAVTVDKPYTDLASVNTTAGKYVRQTYRRFNYQPGKSQLIQMTGVLELASGVTTGCTRRVGPFDDDNGCFFESNEGVISAVIRTHDSGSAVDTKVAITAWNLDTLDGGDDAANPSGITINWTMAQQFVIDYQWLSVGRVRFGLRVGGSIVYVHEHLQANLTTIPWSSTPNLPLRYELETTASSGVCSMRCICSAVMSEGGTDHVGSIRRDSTGGFQLATTSENTLYALMGLRLKATSLGATIKLLKTSLQVHTTTEYAEWYLLWNPTVADTFTYGDVTDSNCQTAKGGVLNTVTGGHQIDGGYIESGGNSASSSGRESDLDSSLILGADIAGTAMDEYVLCIRPIGGASAMEIEGGITWREL